MTDKDPPIDDDLPIDAQPIGAEPPIDGALPIGDDIPVDDKLPVAADLPIDDEQPIGDEPPINDGQQEEDWDRIIPEDWVKEPFFRKDVDVWFREVQTIIQEGWAKRGRTEQMFDDGCLRSLHCLLAEYIETCAMWDGTLSAADRDCLKKVQGAASKLLLAIQGLKNETRDSTWYLASILREDPGKWSLDELTRVLQCVHQFEFRSPRLGGPQAKRWKSPAEMNARGNLQERIDGWWTTYSGLPRAADPLKAPAFHDFLAATFGPISLRYAPSHSETAIKEARRAYKAARRAYMAKQAKWQAVRKRLGEYISRQEALYGPEGPPFFRVERPGGTLP